MKSLKLLIAGIALIISGAFQTTGAQVSVTVGTPPPWGPTEASGIRFYYMPDIQVYYDVNLGEYVYFSGGTWIHAHELPRAYRNYDLYGSYKVPLRDYRGEHPWENHKVYIKSYPKGYNHGQHQKTFKERPHDEHDRK